MYTYRVYPDMYGDLSPKRIKEISGIDRAYNILRMNVYGWFYNIKKGVYGITTEGRKGLWNIPNLKNTIPNFYKRIKKTAHLCEPFFELLFFNILASFKR